MEDENSTQTDTIIPTFLTKPHSSSASSAHLHKSLHVLRRSRTRWRHAGTDLMIKQQQRKKEEKSTNNVEKKEAEEEEEEEEEEEAEEEEDEREEVEKKIHALQKIVPGGESFGVDKLFDETAGYIVALQYQVKKLRTLTAFFEKLQKDKTKLGG